VTDRARGGGIAPVRTIEWEGDLPGTVRLLDQAALPAEERYLRIETAEEMRDAIRRLAVRGAPAIGVAAAFGVVLGVQSARARDGEGALAAANAAADLLAAARPTALAPFRLLGRMRGRARAEAPRGADAVLRGLLEEAMQAVEEDRRCCEAIGEAGAALLRDGDAILTHCNAGALATASSGTALAIVYRAAREGKRIRVFADETRPLLQGARLTAWELARAGIEVSLLADAAAASLLRNGTVAAVLVGADRIARNGDVANKVGTYPLALASEAHAIPFYVAAPLETIDLEAATGEAIPIESRGAEEVVLLGGRRVAPEGVKVFNPAFDVTPARLVSALVTEAGVLPHPDEASVTALLAGAHRPRRG